MRKVLKPFLSLEVERFTNNIVNKTIVEMDLSNHVDDYILIKKNGDRIENITYQTKEINRITNEVTKRIQDTIKDIDEGVIDDYFVSNKIKNGKFHKVRNGVFCEISLGTIRHSILFANVGPTIPIRLIFLGQVNTEVKIETKEYGMNNIMVEVILIVRVNEMISMPISSDKKEIVIKEPLSIEIIQGELPKYLYGSVK